MEVERQAPLHVPGLALAEVFVKMNKVHAEEFIPELRAATADTYLQPWLFDRLRNAASSAQTGAALALAEVFVKMNKVHAEEVHPRAQGRLS